MYKGKKERKVKGRRPLIALKKEAVKEKSNRMSRFLINQRRPYEKVNL